MSCLCDMNGRGKASHCRACCLTFSGPWAFDQHITQAAHRRPEDSGLVQVRAGVWGRASGEWAERREAL